MTFKCLYPYSILYVSLFFVTSKKIDGLFIIFDCIDLDVIIFMPFHFEISWIFVLLHKMIKIIPKSTLSFSFHCYIADIKHG